ncbi:MAG TPA: hypothetical protein VIH70_04100, partial [Actinomycetota bacterium]
MFVLVVLAFVVSSGHAAAALWVTLDPTSGAPGETIRVRTAGQGAMAIARPGDAMSLYLRGGLPGSATEETPLEVGQITVDSGLNGVGSFVVPALPAARYEVRLRCEPCAEFSFGNTLLWVADFTITAPMPSTDTEPTEDVTIPAALVALLVVVPVLLR